MKPYFPPDRSKIPHYYIVFGEYDYKTHNTYDLQIALMDKKEAESSFFEVQDYFDSDISSKLEFPKSGQMFMAGFKPINKTTALIFAVLPEEEGEKGVSKKIHKTVRENLLARQGILEVDYDEVRELFEDDDELLQEFDDLF